MKYIAITLLVMHSVFFSMAQKLEGTEWITLKIERKDGSLLVDRMSLKNKTLKWSFKKDSVLRSIDTETHTQYYKIENNRLSIAIQQFSIDTLSKNILILTEIPTNDLPDDRIDRYFFINSNVYFSYLLLNNKINSAGDSLIYCNHQCAVTTNISLGLLFQENFNTNVNDESLSGTLTFAHDGFIKDIQLDPNDKFSRKELAQFSELLMSPPRCT